EENKDDADDADDEEDEEDEEDLESMGDFAPLASSNRSYNKLKSASPSSSLPRVSHPCKVLATVFGTAMVVSLAFALLSLLHLNSNTSLDSEPGNGTLMAPVGISIDDFTLKDFKLPPWNWDINSYLPINITNGPKFTHIQWKNGEQYLQVDCPDQANYQYHFQSFPKDEFRDHPTASQGIDDLLPLGEEPYVFVLCPPGQDNTNLVFREFDMPDEPLPEAPPHIDGTLQAPQPLLDDVVMILVDAISRAKFRIEMQTVMETFAAINSTGSGAGAGHRIFDFEHYNVLGQNSPPNKAYIYSGQSIEHRNDGAQHWLWDAYEEQGFTTAHTDGECGGERGITDYTTGAITFEYSHKFHRLPAQHQMSQLSWCENHDMYASGAWGKSCTLPAEVNYNAALMGGMRWNTPYCAGEKAIHKHIMENLEGWLVSTKGQRRFATYSFMDAHSPNGQPPLLSPKSALVIMADHGLHYGRETYTFPGFIHHKIPPLFVALPNQLLAERPDFAQALEQNQNRILSHLDLHQTFHHLAYGDMPVGNYAQYMTDFIADGTFRRQFHPNAPNETSYAQIYGRSLLLPIEEDRSCRTAGIPHDFCAFQPFLSLDPSKAVDSTFMRSALLLLARRMNELTQIYHVDDVCRPSSLVLQPAQDMSSVSGSFDDIGTGDLVMESAYASASANRMLPQQKQQQDAQSETRVFYFMVRDRHRPDRKYTITMKEDDVLMGQGESVTIQQLSAYAAAWHPCAVKIAEGGKAIGNWQEAVKQFCVCS
ncbi:hypothetical protein BGZ54_002557, partial [Gamsiella multidivaricata]